MFSWFGYADVQQKSHIKKNHAKHQLIQGEKSTNNSNTMITTKVAPSVKSTSVNVIFDDIVVNNNMYSEPEAMTSNEPFRSASISLSIELAKKSSMSSISTKSKPIPFMQKPDNISITPHSSLPKSMAIQKQLTKRSSASITSNSSNSLLQRMAHSPKASAAAFPTSVSANGNVIYDYYNSSTEELAMHENNNDNIVAEPTNRSAAIESLTKKIDITTTSSTSTITTINSSIEQDTQAVVDSSITEQDTLAVVDSTPIEDTLDETTNKIELSTCKNNSDPKEEGGFWSWLGFSTTTAISENESKQESIKKSTDDDINIGKENQSNIDTIDQQQPSASTHNMNPSSSTATTSSWTSYLFSSKPTHIPTKKQEETSTKLMIEQTLSSSPVQINDNNLPIMKETKSLQQDDMLRKVKSTSSLIIDNQHQQSIRYSASNSSINMTHNRPKKKNIVLPPFDSQFISTEPSEVAVQQQPTNNSNMLIKAIDAINSILIQSPPDQPEDTSNWIAKRMRAKFSHFVEDMKSLDPKTIIDKRIVVVGVHGWFPMKVSMYNNLCIMSV